MVQTDRTRRDKNRRKMHTQVTTISNVLRFKERLPQWRSLLWAPLPINTIHITFAALHCVQAVITTLILMPKQHVVMHLLKGTNKYHLGSKKGGDFSSISSVCLSSSKTLTKQVGAAVTLRNYDRKLAGPVPGGPTAVLTEGFIWYFSLPAGQSTSTVLRLARPFPFKSVHIHNSPVTLACTLPTAS